MGTESLKGAKKTLDSISNFSYKEIQWKNLEVAKEALGEKIEKNDILAVKLGSDGSNVVMSMATFNDLISAVKLFSPKSGNLIQDNRKNLEMLADEVSSLAEDVFDKKPTRRVGNR